MTLAIENRIVAKERNGYSVFVTLSSLFNYCVADFIEYFKPNMAEKEEQAYKTRLLQEFLSYTEQEKIEFVGKEYGYMVITNPTKSDIEGWEEYHERPFEEGATE